MPNPLPPELGVPLNAELARRGGLDVEFHRFPLQGRSVIRFHVNGEILQTQIVKTTNMVELAKHALMFLRSGAVDW